MASFSRTAKTTAEEVAAALKDQIAGKTILITGVSPNGLGAYFAQTVAAHNPALLILASRSPSKITATESAIHSAHPDVQTRRLTLDLASLAAVRAAAAEVLAYPEPIDVLVNNAGIMAVGTYTTTADGVEAQFGTNHLGHFLFTNLVLPKILAARGEKRIVNVSSSGHRITGIRWEDVNFDDGKAYDKWAAYGQTKTANILFSIALAQKLADRGVKAFSLHPGAIGTNLTRHVPDEEINELLARMKTKYPGFSMKTLPEGTSTHIVASFDPAIADKNGAYLDNCDVAEPESWARSPEDAERLWKLSEKLVGQEFNY